MPRGRVDRWVAALTGWRGVVAALLAVVFLALGARDLPGALDAAHGRGIPGVFRVETAQTCARPVVPGEVCSWTGTFTSDDGSVMRRDVLLDVDQGWRPGDVVPVLAPGVHGSDVVYLDRGDRSWVALVALVVAGGACLTAVAVALVLRLLGRGRPVRRGGPPRHRGGAAES